MDKSARLATFDRVYDNSDNRNGTVVLYVTDGLCTTPNGETGSYVYVDPQVMVDLFLSGRLVLAAGHGDEEDIDPPIRSYGRPLYVHVNPDGTSCEIGYSMYTYEYSGGSAELKLSTGSVTVDKERGEVN